METERRNRNQCGSVPSPRNERVRGGVANEGAERPRERPRPERASGGGTERVSRKKMGGGARKEGAISPRLEGTPDYRCAEAATAVARCERREQPLGRGGRGTPDRGAKGGDPLRLPASAGRRPSGRKTQAQVHMCKRQRASRLDQMTFIERGHARHRPNDQVIIGTRSTATNQGDGRI